LSQDFCHWISESGFEIIEQTKKTCNATWKLSRRWSQSPRGLRSGNSPARVSTRAWMFKIYGWYKKIRIFIKTNIVKGTYWVGFPAANIDGRCFILPSSFNLDYLEICIRTKICK
jgi:hypothetical protein